MKVELSQFRELTSQGARFGAMFGVLAAIGNIYASPVLPEFGFHYGYIAQILVQLTAGLISGFVLAWSAFAISAPRWSFAYAGGFKSEGVFLLQSFWLPLAFLFFITNSAMNFEQCAGLIINVLVLKTIIYIGVFWCLLEAFVAVCATVVWAGIRLVIYFEDY